MKVTIDFHSLRAAQTFLMDAWLGRCEIEPAQVNRLNLSLELSLQGVSKD